MRIWGGKSSAGWREIAGNRYYFRSKWEANYAKHLDFIASKGLIKEWKHEPDTFWFDEIKRGVRSYLPDFRITENDGKVWYAEVKGYYDSKTLTKIKRFRKYYPQFELHLIDKKWFGKNNGLMRNFIKDWE